tara:strand:+ start:1698 stop:2603 length:906 start_codon:yes stop_codon:yes gene_type:complete
MANIGGLDVSYGARHQIVRNNTFVVQTDTAALTKAQGIAIFDALTQGLGHTILNPDYLVAISAANTHTLGVVGDYQVDTTGNGTADSTLVANGPLVRDYRQVPISGSYTGEALSGTTALNTIMADTDGVTHLGGNLVLDAVLNVGAVIMGATVGTGSASAFNVGEENPGGSEHTANDAALIGEITLGGGSSEGVYSAALATCLSAVDGTADIGTAGVPEAQVGLLNLKAPIDNLIQGLTSTNPSEATIASNTALHATNGLGQAGATGVWNYETMIVSADSGGATLGAAMGAVSTVCVAKVL